MAKMALYGELFIGSRDANGNVCKWVGTGCQDNLDLDVSTSDFEHKSGCSGVNVTDFSRETERTVSVSTTLSEFKFSNMLRALNGNGVAADTAPVAVTAKSVCATVGANAISAGSILSLGAMNITSLTLKDGAGVTIPSGNYTLKPEFGSLTMNAASPSYTGPITADFSYQNPLTVGLMAKATELVAVRFEGYNAGASGAPGVFELYQVKLALDGTLSIYTSEMTLMQLKGAAQADSNKSSNLTTNPLGQFGILRGFGMTAT